MGLFVAKDGSYQSWLATLLCCCAAVDIDEHPAESDRSPRAHASTQTRVAVWDAQPVPLRPLPLCRPPSFPITRRYTRGDEFIRDEDRVRPIAERPPSLKPLELGDGSLLGRNRLSWHVRQKASPVLSGRPSIGNPTDFRRLDYSDNKRLSLVPLKLSPVVLNPEPYSSAPPFDNRQASTREDLVLAGKRASYREARSSPYQRIAQLSSTNPNDPSQIALPERAQTMAPIREHRSSRPSLSAQSSSSSLHSVRRDGHSSSTPSRPASEVTQSSASSVRSSRRNVDSSAASTPVRTLPWPKRKRSHSLFRKNSTESVDWELDKEILELNTIVEERRAEASRPHTSQDKHVPAVAPWMAGRARSETLNDIGSAFSRPILAGSLPVAMTKRLSRPFTSVPELYTGPAMSPTTSHSGQRLSGWLSNLESSPNRETPREGLEDRVPLVRGRHVSQSSLLTSPDDSDVPSLTAASTPTSLAKGHHRSSTADSRTAPSSPPAAIYEHEKFAQDGHAPWRQERPVSPEDDFEVGMAL